MSDLYKPVIVKKEIDDSHYYFVDDKFTPGVTSILQETMPTPYALRQWIGDVGNDKAEQKLQQAGDRGTAIHAACERLLAGEEIKLKELFPKQADQKCIVGFANWCAEFQPDVKNIEFVVASKLGFAGTLDIFCEIAGEPYIIDIKTSSAVYDSHKLQIAAYQAAFKEMTGIEATVAILHLNPRTIKGWSFHKNPEIKDKPVTIEDFMTVFEMYKMLNGGVIPEPDLTTVYPELISLKGSDEKN